MRNNRRHGRIFFIIQAIVLICFILLIENDKKLVKTKDFDTKFMAASKMKVLTDAIRDEKINRGILIDSTIDINNTGIIGVDINGITTTLGSIESKRTSANPNFAALIIDMFNEIGLRPGDNVAINFSSSFPGLNIATIVACEALDLNPIIITSIGSSTWGGNNLEFTYLDMEEFLYNEGLIKNKSIAVSIGGEGDLGKDMNQDDLDIILNRLKDNDKEIITLENLHDNIKKRMDIYYGDVDIIHGFVNVGGNIVSFGNTLDSLDTPPGILKGMDYKIDNKSGLVQLFYKKGVPVVHLLNVKELANKYNLEIDPNRPFTLGKGGIYYLYYYNYGMIIFVIYTSIVSLLVYKKRIKNYYEEK